METFEGADEVVLDVDLAGRADRHRQGFAVAPAAHQPRRAAVDEPLGETLVQGVRQPVLDGAGPFLPVGRVFDPIAVKGDVGPGAHVGDALDQGFDAAVGAFDARHVPGHPVGGQLAGGRHQIAVDAPQQPGVGFAHSLLEVGDAAHLPQQRHGIGAVGGARDVRLAGEGGEDAPVVGVAGPGQPGRRGGRRQAGQKRLGRGEIEVRVAPHEGAEGLEGMVLDALDDFRVQGLGLARRAEGAVVHVAPGAPGDLRQLGDRQVARGAAVELALLGEGDVVELQVEAHADGVGGHQVIDLAGLVQGDLGVAGARAQRPHHHRRAAALAAHELGDGVDVGRREGDHGAARRQARDLAAAGVGKR